MLTSDRQAALDAAVWVWRTRVEASTEYDQHAASATTLSALGGQILRLAEYFEDWLAQDAGSAKSELPPREPASW